MQFQILAIPYVFLVFFQNTGPTLANYWLERDKLLQDDKTYATGANWQLTSKEEKVNDVLMYYKLNELDEGFANPENFLAGQHFFKAKEKIEKSKVFDIIKLLPKGASLHSHDDALVSQEYLYNLTYSDNLYGCLEEQEIKLYFFPKNNVSKTRKWTLVNEMRNADSTFDDFLKSKLSIISAHPDIEYPTIHSVWSRFEKVFDTVGGLLSFRPVFQNYFYQVLKELYEDNIRYAEFRGYIASIYDLNGHIYSPLEVIEIFLSVIKKFRQDYPDFYGVRFIFSPSRKVDTLKMDNFINIYKQIKTAYPEFIAGFDLVGQEDLGNPLTTYLPQLLELKQQGTEFFFHAAETNWLGQSTDLNLFDAILLGTTRIGHGYAVIKHPVISRLVKENNIAIEICPISNQVLKLVDDFRNHPGTILIANDFPVVIASDDPSFWGAKGLSYDWYVVFMAMTSREMDLRFLKQLAINSIKYSSLGESDKQLALAQWVWDWELFLEKVLYIYNYY